MDLKDRDIVAYYIKKLLTEELQDKIAKEEKRMANSRAAKNIKKAKAKLSLLNKIK